MNKYSESFKLNIENTLNKIYTNNQNIIYDIYSKIIFNKNIFKIKSLEDKLITNKKEFIIQLSSLLKSSKERNRGINLKNIFNYFESYFKTEITDEEELSLIESLLSEPNLYLFYDNLFSNILKGYITFISKFPKKFNHIVTIYEIINKNKDNFNTFFNQLISVHFSNINQQQVFLAYLLLIYSNESNNNKLLLEYVFDILKNAKKQDFILSIA
jgi:hypothetical protein